MPGDRVKWAENNEDMLFWRVTSHDKPAPPVGSSSFELMKQSSLVSAFLRVTGSSPRGTCLQWLELCDRARASGSRGCRAGGRW